MISLQRVIGTELELAISADQSRTQLAHFSVDFRCIG